MKIFNRKFWPIHASLAFLGLMVLFTVTPIVWILTGRPPESYPELFFGIYGVPFAFLLVVASSLFALWRRKKP